MFRPPRLYTLCLRSASRRPDSRFWSRTRYSTIVHPFTPETPSATPVGLWTAVDPSSIRTRTEKDGTPAKAPVFADFDQFVQPIRKQLGRAIETINLSDAERLWSRFSSTLADTRQEAMSEDQTKALLGAYEHFLFAFLKLRRANMALQVWNAMIRRGCTPTVQTWSIMIKGCQYDRDHRRAEEMWLRMRAAAIKPDLHAWTTRIFVLMRLNKTREGFKALDEMANEWINAVGRRNHAQSALDEIDGVPKPNVVVVNAAAAALASQNSSLIPRVLTWGTRFRIEPDITTYNILINASLARQDPDEATRILQLMRERGISCDPATYTIILNSVFRSSSFSQLSAVQQTEQIMSLIRVLEADGTSIDERGYALIVDRLLKQCNDTSGANAVLAHMTSSTPVRPTAHMYTILMTHHFQQTPPDVRATDALWQQITQTANYAETLDVIFYDRMIEGYARCGEMGRMMAFLTRMSKQGKRPGWLALAAVVTCLARENDWERVRRVVADAEHGQGLLWAGMRGTKGQAEFWDLVRGMNLAREEV